MLLFWVLPSLWTQSPDLSCANSRRDGDAFVVVVVVVAATLGGSMAAIRVVGLGGRVVVMRAARGLPGRFSVCTCCKVVSGVSWKMKRAGTLYVVALLDCTDR